MRDQLYCFEDRGNRRVALRPELTPSLARLVIQKGYRCQSLISIFFSVQKICVPSTKMVYHWTVLEAEAELISSIIWFFKRIGITAADVEFKVSSRKVLQEVLRCYSIPETLFGRVCVIIDKRPYFC